MASVSEIGKIPTRVFKYGEGRERERTVRLTADLRLKMQDIAGRVNDGEIRSGEAARLSCIAIFGQSFWDKVPFDMADEPTTFAVGIMKEILGVEDDESTEPDAPEPDPKNEDTPPSEG